MRQQQQLWKHGSPQAAASSGWHLQLSQAGLCVFDAMLCNAMKHVRAVLVPGVMSSTSLYSDAGRCSLLRTQLGRQDTAPDPHAMKHCEALGSLILF